MIFKESGYRAVSLVVFAYHAVTGTFAEALNWAIYPTAGV
jgi:hypothetical protein